MNTLFNVFLWAGLLFMAVSLVLDLLDGAFDFLVFDVFSFDIGNISIGIVPISLLSLSMWSVVFGVLGLFLSKSLDQTITLVVSTLVGYLFAVIVQTVLVKLKKVKNLTENVESILDRKAFVCNRIGKDSYGNVSFSKPDGSVVSFPAKSCDGSEIQQGVEVDVTDFKSGVVYVKRKG